jgi:UDP-glucose 4-epimerase
MFFEDGEERLSLDKEYNSFNTKRLNVEQVKDKLLELDYVRNEIKRWKEQ